MNGSHVDYLLDANNILRLFRILTYSVYIDSICALVIRLHR